MIGLIKRWIKNKRVERERFTQLVEDVLKEDKRRTEWKGEEWIGMTAEEIASEIYTNSMWRERLKEVDG